VPDGLDDREQRSRSLSLRRADSKRWYKVLWSSMRSIARPASAIQSTYSPSSMPSSWWLTTW